MQAVVNQSGGTSFYRDVNHVTSGGAIADVTGNPSDAAKFSPSFRKRYPEDDQEPYAAVAAAAFMSSKDRLRHQLSTNAWDYFQRGVRPENDDVDNSSPPAASESTETEGLGPRSHAQRHQPTGGQSFSFSDRTSANGLVNSTTTEDGNNWKKSVHESDDRRRQWAGNGNVSMDHRSPEFSTGYPVDRQRPVADDDITDVRWHHVSSPKKHLEAGSTPSPSRRRAASEVPARRCKPEAVDSSESEVGMLPAISIDRSTIPPNSASFSSGWFPVPVDALRNPAETDSISVGTPVKQRRKQSGMAIDNKMAAIGRESTASFPSGSDAGSGNGGLEPLGALFRRYDLLASSSSTFLSDSTVHTGELPSSSGKTEAKFKAEPVEMDKIYDKDSSAHSYSGNDVVGRSGSPDDSHSQSMHFYSPRRQSGNDVVSSRKNESFKDQPFGRFSPENDEAVELRAIGDYGGTGAGNYLPAGDHATEDRGVNRTYRTSNRYKNPKKCKYCDWTSVSKEELWLHLAVHVPPEKLLRCEVCPFVTELKHHLESHRLNHSEEKPYRCDLCNYRAVNQSMINSHRKKHFPDRPYACTYSGCTFRTKFANQLKQHRIKKRHFVVTADIPQPTGNGNQRPTAAGNGKSSSVRGRSQRSRAAREHDRMLRSEAGSSEGSVAGDIPTPCLLDTALPSLMAASVAAAGSGSLFGDPAAIAAAAKSSPGGWLMAAAATAAVAAAAGGWNPHNLAAAAAASKLFVPGATLPAFHSPPHHNYQQSSASSPLRQVAGVAASGLGSRFTGSPLPPTTQLHQRTVSMSAKSGSSASGSPDIYLPAASAISALQFSSPVSSTSTATSCGLNPVHSIETSCGRNGREASSASPSTVVRDLMQHDQRNIVHRRSKPESVRPAHQKEFKTNKASQFFAHDAVSPFMASTPGSLSFDQSRDRRQLPLIKQETMHHGSSLLLQSSAAQPIAPIIDLPLPLDLTKKTTHSSSSPSSSSVDDSVDQLLMPAGSISTMAATSHHSSRRASRRKGVAHKLDVVSANRFENYDNGCTAVDETLKQVVGSVLTDHSFVSSQSRSTPCSVSSSSSSSDQLMTETAGSLLVDVQVAITDDCRKTVRNTGQNVGDNGGTKEQQQQQETQLCVGGASGGKPEAAQDGDMPSASLPSPPSHPVPVSVGKECPFCDCVFRHDVMYAIHMEFHSADDPWTCRKCLVKCSDRVNFFQHIATVAHK